MRHFHHFYCYLFVEFDKFWLSEKPRDVMEFNRIRFLGVIKKCGIWWHWHGPHPHAWRRIFHFPWCKLFHYGKLSFNKSQKKCHVSHVLTPTLTRVFWWHCRHQMPSVKSVIKTVFKIGTSRTPPNQVFFI